MLVLEIAAGVCLGILAVPALWLLATAINRWRKYEKMVRDLSRRYSKHLLREAGVKLSLRADALETYIPIDGGEEKFDPDRSAKIDELGRRVDAMRDDF
jgi:uncharacterized protein YjiS (DUF1127 family)